MLVSSSNMKLKKKVLNEKLQDTTT